MAATVDKTALKDHRVVSRAAWIEARKQLLAKEKEFTRLRDALSQQRRDLPWERSMQGGRQIVNRLEV